MLISRELHDELGQSLTAVKMDLSSILKNTGNIKSVTPKLDKTLKLVDGIIKDVQRISSELRPGILDDLGLTSAIEWHCEEFEARTGIKCELNLEEIRIKNPQKNTGIYRILQESLTNIARHSEAKNVIVRLKQIKEDINLVIRDDGIGIPEEKMESNSSLGLIGIRERIKQFNGRIDIESVKDKGTKISVIIPIDN
jgi:signal transduction histidine kinase